MNWFLVLGGFFLGAIPFAVIIGKLGLRKNIRDYGDGNPGAFNVIRAGNIAWGGLAVFLEISKGALPVGIGAYILQLEGLELIAVSVAPALGHAFSPFLGFKGGKAIAAIFGTWIGLSIIPVPLLSVLLLLHWYFALTSSGWAVFFTWISVLFYLILSSAPTTWFIIWIIHFLIVIYKHRTELRNKPELRLSPLLRPFFKNLDLRTK